MAIDLLPHLPNVSNPERPETQTRVRSSSLWRSDLFDRGELAESGAADDFHLLSTSKWPLLILEPWRDFGVNYSRENMKRRQRFNSILPLEDL